MKIRSVCHGAYFMNFLGRNNDFLIFGEKQTPIKVTVGVCFKQVFKINISIRNDPLQQFRYFAKS